MHSIRLATYNDWLWLKIMGTKILRPGLLLNIINLVGFLVPHFWAIPNWPLVKHQPFVTLGQQHQEDWSIITPHRRILSHARRTLKAKRKKRLQRLRGDLITCAESGEWSEWLWIGTSAGEELSCRNDIVGISINRGAPSHHWFVYENDHL